MERPIRQRVLGCLLGIAVLVDLSAYDPVRFVLSQPRQFHMPWLPVWPSPEVTELNTWIVRGVTVLVCLGAGALYWGRRWGAWVALLFYGYLFLDHQPNYTNNGYLLLLLLFVAGSSELVGETPAWPRRVGQIALSSMYLGGGLCKLSSLFLSGSILRQALLHYGWRYAAWSVPDQPWLFAAASCAAAVLELALAFGLWWRPARRVLVPLGLAFHLTIEVFMPVRFFVWACAASYALFMDERTLDALVSRARTLARPEAWLPGVVALAVLLERPAYGVSVSGAICVALGIASSTLWLRRNPTPRAQPERTSHALAVGAVSAMICLQLFCLVKPALGWSKRFAWQMFSEVLVMRVDPRVHTARGYRSAAFPGAEPRYRTDGFRYHWTSWSEERLYLQGYAQWLADTFALRDVRVIVRYRHNDAQAREAVFQGHNPHGTQP